MLATAWSVLLLAWLTLHWGILPRIDNWRPEIEQRLSQAVGVPVRIGRIEVQSSGWVPAVSLRDVVLIDRNGQPGLKLPHVAAAIAPQTLLSFRLRLSQLYLENPELDVRRDASGRWIIGGIQLDPNAGREDGELADWFFQQREFVIRAGQLRWTDELRGLPTLQLRDVDVAVRNGLRSHDWRIDATPPIEWGERFTLRAQMTQPLLARAGDWQRWSGTLYANLPRAEAPVLQRYVPGLPFTLNQGSGAARAWLAIEKGNWRSLTADLSWRDVDLQWTAPGVQPLQLKQLQARAEFKRTADTLEMGASNLQFETADALHWPASRYFVSVKQRQQGPWLDGAAPVTGGIITADQIDLTQLAELSTHVPLPASVRHWLDELAPRGTLRGLALNWDGPAAQPQRYKLQTRLGGLSIAAGEPAEAGHLARPGVRNADIELEADEKGGKARWSTAQGALELPGVFEDPLLLLDTLNARVSWRITPPTTPGGTGAAALPRIDVRLDDARFANADAQGSISARWRTGDGTGVGRGGRYPGQLDLTGRIDRGLASSVARYLPLHLPASARRYVERAIVAGDVRDVDVRIRGDVWDMPYDRGRIGEFRFAGRADNVVLAYAPGGMAPGAAPQRPDAIWPALTQGHAEWAFDKTSMTIRNARAALYGVAIKGVTAQVADLAQQPVLEMEGVARGPLADMLRYVNATPIGGWTARALSGAQANGTADLKLTLALVLHHMEQSTVQGALTLGGNDLRIHPDTPALAAARGRVDFTHKDFKLVGATARAVGGDLALEGGSAPDGSIRLAGQGTASADGLRRARELGFAARVAAAMTGQTPYRLQLGVVKGRMELALTSPMTGMALDLPAPLRKPADASWPMRYEIALDSGGAPRDVLKFQLGQAVQAEYQRDLSGPTPQVLQGSAALFDTPPSAAPGVVASARLGRVDGDAWLAVLKRWAADDVPATPPATAASAAARAEADRPTPTSAYIPARMLVRAQALSFAGRPFTDVDATVQRSASLEGETWRATVASNQMAGLVEYRGSYAPGAGARIYARLDRLSLAKTEGEGIDALVEPSATTTLPTLDVVVNDFELRGMKLGRLEVEANNRAAAEGREWNVEKLSLDMPEAHLAARGQWAESPRKRMALDLRLDLKDSGDFLERLNMGRVLRGGEGRLTGQIAWTGSPLSPNPQTMTGQGQLNVDAGRFLKVDPGAARLLGVLSLQSLPRRLSLDFRDLFQEGFAFDNVGSDFVIAQGQLSTRNFRMRGVQALVLLEGTADLRDETQNLHVVVVPEINAGAASLAYAAINPAIGLGTFLAQMFLRGPLAQAGTREFKVTGPWAEPKVEQIARGAAPGASAAADAAQPPAPSGSAAAR